jgi:hypothetical protein
VPKFDPVVAPDPVKCLQITAIVACFLVIQGYDSLNNDTVLSYLGSHELYIIVLWLSKANHNRARPTLPLYITIAYPLQRSSSTQSSCFLSSHLRASAAADKHGLDGNAFLDAIFLRCQFTAIAFAVCSSARVLQSQ